MGHPATDPVSTAEGVSPSRGPKAEREKARKGRSPDHRGEKAQGRKGEEARQRSKGTAKASGTPREGNTQEGGRAEGCRPAAIPAEACKRQAGLHL